MAAQRPYQHIFLLASDPLVDHENIGINRESKKPWLLVSA